MLSAKLTNAQRKAIYRRDGFRCALCDSTKYIQLHHIISRGAGGSDHPHNLITLCSDCHAAAHGMMLREWPDVTEETMEQAIVEYMSDLYAEQGHVWNPYRNPLTKRPNLDDPNIWCPICTNGPHGTRKCPGGTPFCAQWAP